MQNTVCGEYADEPLNYDVSVALVNIILLT